MVKQSRNKKSRIPVPRANKELGWCFSLVGSLAADCCSSLGPLPRLAGLFLLTLPSVLSVCIHFTRDFGSAAGRGSGIACCRPAASAASGRRRIRSCRLEAVVRGSSDPYLCRERQLMDTNDELCRDKKLSSVSRCQCSKSGKAIGPSYHS
ncbi:hypothetical protein HDV63DRAFT_367288 [Trichoderma sp. SZMC 28014]